MKKIFKEGLMIGLGATVSAFGFLILIIGSCAFLDLVIGR